jgi:PAS domain S-box-containing protein
MIARKIFKKNAVFLCYGVSFLICAVLFLGTYYVCRIEKALEIAAVYRDTSNISRAVEEHAIRTFEQASLLAMSIRSRYEQEDKLDLNSLAQVNPNAMRIFQLLSIINEKGMVSGSSMPGFAPVDLSEREHFKVHLKELGPELFVSKPVLGKVSGKWSIQLTTRLTKADKSFAGVVVVSLDPFYLSSFYKDIDIGPHGSIILAGWDGVVRAQKGMTEPTVGRTLDDAVVNYLNDTQWRQANYTMTDSKTGDLIFSSFRSVQGFPLSVIINVTEGDALAALYTRQTGYYSFAACLSGLVFVLAAWMARLFNEMREVANRLKIVFDHSPVGMMHVAADGTVLDCNDKFAQQMGAPSNESLLGANAATQSNEPLRDNISKALNGQGSEYEGPYTSSAGHKASALRMIFNPVSVGRKGSDIIITSEDISERMHDQEMLQTTSERLQLATKAAGIGIWDYDIVNNVLMWDDIMHTIYDVDNSRHPLNLEGWLATLHPEDVHGFGSAFRRAITGEDDFAIEFRVICVTDGSIHHVRADAIVNRNSSGLPVRMVGTNLDITARKSAQLELQAAYAEIEQRVAQRTQELARANEMLHAEIVERKLAHREIDQILSSISSVLIGVDRWGKVFRWNDAAEHSLRLSAREVVGRSFTGLTIPWDWESVLRGVEKTCSELNPQRIYNLWYERSDGNKGYFVISVGPIHNEDDGYGGFLILGDDISEVKFLEAQLSQAAKLEAIGQLAAGIAHEINTPTQYVGDSVTFLRDAFQDIERLMQSAADMAQLPESVGPDTSQSVKVLLEEIDSDFLREEIPKTFDRIFDGIERISTIVQAMKRFSYTSGDEKKVVDLRGAIENTLIISRNEWKYVAKVETSFDPELTDILCLPGDLNQVLLNIIVNAAHAIGDVVQGTNELGLILVSTKKEGDMATICIRDTGPGIPESVGDKVFNLFFTTKEVGKGTGQGLAIAYDIVVHKHGGTISFESEPGNGTAFFIRIPING